jgi:HK97 gp10 family phage protein
MAKSEVRMEGLSELLDKLKALPSEIGSKGGGPLRLALLTAAKVMRDDAQARAPVDTGRLKRNIIVFRDRDPRSSGVTEQYGVTFRRGKKGLRGRKRYHTTARGEKDAFYGRWVEFGTSKMPAQPFLRPAFEAKKMESAEVFRTKLADAIDKAVKKMQRRARRG